MRKLSVIPLAVVAALLAGCTAGEDPLFYTAPETTSDTRVSVSHKTISVREVSLPAYASDEEISVAFGNGQIAEDAGNLWADDPVRSVTLRLTHALGDITRRTVAADPWPYRSPPEATVDVRLEEFVAQTSGVFVARGQYYIAHEDIDLLGKSRTFDLSARFDPAGGYSAIAVARSQVIGALALEVAQKGLR